MEHLSEINMEYIKNIEGAPAPPPSARPIPPPAPIYSLYIPHIFPKYIPYLSLVFSHFIQSKVGPDMTEVRLLVQFRTCRIQS